MANPPKLTLMPPKQFDDAKLESLTEPFNVRVEKLRGSQRMPIPLPESEEAPGQPGGTGYDRNSVRTLEQYLVTEWSGGGAYAITITDATGQSMTWNSTFDTNIYPEIIPPPLRTAATNPKTQAPRIPPMAPAFPNGFPQQQPYMQAQPQYGYQPQPYGYMMPPMPPAPPIGTPQFGLWREEAKDRQENAELARLREDKARAERAAADAQHAREMERTRVETESRFAKQDQALEALRTMVGQLTSSITAANAATANTSKPNEALEAMRLQLAESQRRSDEERHARETDRRERETKDMLAQMAANTQRQIETMQRQMEVQSAALAAANANRADPMIEMLKEQSRQSAESIKEVARTMSVAMERAQANQLKPSEILQIAKESSSSADAITDKLTHTFGRVIDMQQKVTENALSMQPQGSPVVDLIREGAGNLKEMGERYFGGMELKQKLEAEKVSQQIEAQRDIVIEQTRQQAGLAGMQHHAQQQQHQQEQHVVDQGGNVIAFPPPPSARKKKTKKIEETKPQIKRLGKTDREWFGPLEDDIVKLRAGVTTWLDSLERGEVPPPPPEGIDPNIAAQALAQGAALVIQQQINLPIMTELLFPQRFGDFLDVVLPDAPEAFRTDVISALVPLLRGEVGGGDGMTGEEKPSAHSEPDESDEDGDEDEEADADTDGDPDDGDDAVQETKPVPPPTVRPIVNGRNRPNINPPRRA